MTLFLPDVIGEYVDDPVRYETGGVQYAGYFDPPQIAPEQITHLFLFFQNALYAPVVVNLKINIPTTGGLFRSGPPILKVEEPVIQIKLASAEAGLLTLPVTTGEGIKPGEHPLTLNVKVTTQGRTDRIRPEKSTSSLGRGFIDSPVGLNLVGTIGATYTEKSVKKVIYPLTVSGKPAPPERAPQLKHKYQSIWMDSQMDLVNKAVREINSREVKFQKELTAEALYAMLYAESTSRFADSGLPLRVGEAIVLAKILTYSSQYFLSSPDRRNGLLVPIWERALEAEMDTTDLIEVIRAAGYFHILRLASAISFGVVAKAVGRQHWPVIERQVVVNHIADCIEVNQELDVDFLYLPLLMAGAQISNKLKLNGENPRQTLELLKAAYNARLGLFSESDMERANKIFNQILKKALQQS